MSTLKPFTINIPQAELDGLKDRLSRTRWPEEVPGEPWSMGTDLKSLKNVVEAWEKYDWKRHETELNKLPQFTAEVDGVTLHFVQVQSKRKDATPLLLTHGWPDSFLRFTRVIPLLTDEFHLVIPSIPGFGFSEKKPMPIRDVADLFARLMTDVLGYHQFMAAGGDGGSLVSLALARQYPQKLLGIHLTDAGYPTGQETGLSEPEQHFAQFIQHWWSTQGAYSMVHATKPQAIGVGLDDSPAGLAAWMLSMIDTGSDQHDIEGAFGGKDDLLTNLSLYWFTRTATSAARLSQAEAQAQWSEPPSGRAEVPTAFALFPREAPTPREWVERQAKLVRYNKMPRGGHFAALEVPELFAEDLMAFKNELNA